MPPIRTTHLATSPATSPLPEPKLTSKSKVSKPQKGYCEECQKEVSHIKRHLESKHLGLKPFSCTWEQCDMAFSQKVNLESHINSKHIRIPFKCEVEECNVDGICDRGNMNRHIMSVHCKHNWACPVAGCDRSSDELAYSRRDHLVAHVLKHHPGVSAKGVTGRYTIKQWREMRREELSQLAQVKAALEARSQLESQSPETVVGSLPSSAQSSPILLPPTPPPTFLSPTTIVGQLWASAPPSSRSSPTYTHPSNPVKPSTLIDLPVVPSVPALPISGSGAFRSIVSPVSVNSDSRSVTPYHAALWHDYPVQPHPSFDPAVMAQVQINFVVPGRYLL